jgi:hypothetical protein
VSLSMVGLMEAGMISAGLNWIAGFVGVFAVFFAALATIAYAIVFLGKGISIARDRMGPV